MPIFEYTCECGKHYEELQNEASRHIGCTCGKRANRVYSTFRTIVDFRDGWDAGMGAYVDTKRQRETLLREKGLSKAEDSPDKGRWV